MFSLAPHMNRQEPAQTAKSLPGGSCNGARACQSPSQANALSPRFVVVRRNHNPSPSSPRFRAFGPGPGFFFASVSCRNTSRLGRFHGPCAKPRPLAKLALVRPVRCGSIWATHTTDLIWDQGRNTCNSQNSSQGSARQRYWPDANGMTSTGQGLGPLQGRSLPVRPMAMRSQVQSSARAQVRFATTWACATDRTEDRTPTQLIHADIQAPRRLRVRLVNTPARGIASGGFFVANPRGSASQTHEEGTGYVQ